ncbi:MFS transporter [Paracoccus aerodenitrificans]|uniref:MFS transporter n=1 Tax=Paracoccus aerodenitrificans TaxID=3017781 RepID=UPI0022F12C20|nr:MFS transporter [Paracoccus aerodenitrificans]WBU63571.1 MFS transporter [Paracoccus aerodenitrificans]
MRRALFASGFTTFGLLYYIQSLFPVFSSELNVSPTQSSFSLSLTTGVMAFSLLIVSAISDKVGRKRLMTLSLLSSSILTILMAFAPSWNAILSSRLLMGVSLCGVQSVAMAYLAEEVEPTSFGSTLGLFIGGSALGGMAGRMVSAVIADHFGWEVAVGFMGVLGLAATVYFWVALPDSRYFLPRQPGWHSLASDFKTIIKDRLLLRLFFIGFAVMSGFVTIYNYVSYRLIAAPFELSQSEVGLIFLLYVFGSIGASVGGSLASRFGHNHVLWISIAIMVSGIILTLPEQIGTVLLGLSVLTFGMFASHSISSGWVSLHAKSSKALAASLYLFAYYQGGSLIGAIGGLFWEGDGWYGVVFITAGIVTVGLISAISLIYKRT